MPDADVILVFASTTEVLNVEDFLEENDFSFELVPVPKEVNPNCGLAISCHAQVKDELLCALQHAGFKPESAYIRQGNDFGPLDCGKWGSEVMAS